MAPLVNKLPKSENVLFVFYDLETTQDTRVSDSATQHVPNLVCLLQFCSRCEMQANIDTDCERCGRRRHSFWEYPVGDLLSHLCEPRPWCERVIAISHNARGYDAQFILDRAIVLKWTTELILNGQKIICMKIHHVKFLDSISFMPMALRKLPEAFRLSATKYWYPHLFNTRANLNYVGSIPDMAQEEFTSWYDAQKHKVFDNRRVFEQYVQDDVTFLRKACQLFRRDFMNVENVDIFLESSTIASACIKVLRKRFLKPETVGLIPKDGGYSCYRNYSKKALMWILHMEQTDGCTIMQARNGREFRLHELPRYSVDGYCAETRRVYKLLGLFGTAVNVNRCATTRHWIKIHWPNFYEKTMARIEQIAAAGYTVKVMWECKFDAEKIVERKLELLTHPIVRHSPLYIRDSLYGGRTEALRLHHKIAENEETIQYCDVMSLYPYICKYFKFPIDTSSYTRATRVKTFGNVYRWKD